VNRTLPALVACVIAACASQPSADAPDREGRADRCRYDVDMISEKPALIEVAVECSGSELAGLTIADESLAPYVHEVRETSGRALEREANQWLLSEPADKLAVRYRIDLEGVARATDSFDAAMRVGDSLVAPASTYLLYPEPLRVGVPVTVRFAADDRVATGLRRGATGDSYVLEAHEIPVATYTTFGNFAHRKLPLQGSQSSVTLSVLDGHLVTDVETLASWVNDAATAVTSFWQRFPDNEAMVTIVPIEGRSGVLFGKVLPESAPGVVLMLGEHTTKEQLYADWVLVHEFFHIGFPSFHDEGKWLDEGLATYYEPIIRARAGWIDEQQVWDEFSRSMPQGLHAMNHLGLEKGTDYRDVYWGGAIYCLLADVAIRERTSARAGLENGLHAVLQAGGNSSEVWSLSRTLEVADSAVGVPVLGELARVYAYQPGPIDLNKLWKKLGVVRTTSGIRLDNRAPLAALRRQIVQAAPNSSLAKR
jgi:predicted metalloprotease with PDZ domain